MLEKIINKPAVDERYVRPQAAWEKMKAAQSSRQTVYLYGTTGTGKTTFVTEFLGRKRYHYISLSDMRISEIMELVPEQSETQTILVIDDLQLLEEQGERSACGQIIEELSGRRDVWLILISRAPMPKWLKSVFYRYIFVTIAEEELCLSEQEQEQYLEKWELSPTEAARDKIWELGHGNPLCLRIVALRLKDIPEQDAARDKMGAELHAIEESRRDIWDYAEVHVYDQWSVELQEFMEEVCIVEQFDLQMAQQITKKKEAGRLIQQAKEAGNFLIEFRERERSVYELIPPMKHSMRRRLFAKYSQDSIKALYYSAGNSYEIDGNVREALKMYEMCHCEEGISRILIENTRRNPASGEYFELRHYYLALPEDIIRESVELMAGMSMLQSMLLNEEESERWYQELSAYEKEATGGQKRAAEARLLYLDIALPHRGTIRMIDLLKRAGVLLTERQTVLPELSVTSNLPSMMNGGKDFCEWSKRDRELARSIGKMIEVVLGKFGKGLVNLALAESYFEKGEDNYEVSELAQKGKMQAQAGGKQEQVFVGVGILAWLSVLNNHMDNALESLEGFRTGIVDMTRLLTGVDTLKTRFYLYIGRSSEVADWMKQAPDEDAEFCTLERYRYITKARVYLSVGRREKALRLLMQLQLYAEQRERIYLQIEAKILLAIPQYRMGEEKWKEILQQGITQAEEYHFVRVLSREGAALWELLKAGDFTWQDAGFKKQMAQLYPAYLSEKQEGNVILTDKALKVLRLQAEGLSVEAIAKTLNLSRAGVKYYNQETYKKLGVSSKAAAITEARNRRLL